jgi:hypothetical protein
VRTRLLLAAFAIAALALIGWQRFAINRLRAKIPAVEETTPAGDSHSGSRDERRIPAPPPADTADPAVHLAHLKALAELQQPADQTLGATAWAVSLQSAKALEVALAALTDLPPDNPRRLALAARFGPPLFARWGRVAPLDGLAAWNQVPADLRLAMLPARRAWRAYTADPLEDWAADNLPVNLLEAWLADNPAAFLSDLEGRLAGAAAEPLTQVCLRLAIRNKPLDLLAGIATGPHAALLEGQHVALADALLAVAGSPDEALARLAGAPDSPLRQLVENELSGRVAPPPGRGERRRGR